MVGELIEIDEMSADFNSVNTAFSRYMEDAMFIPTPQVLQKIVTGLKICIHDMQTGICRGFI